MRKCVEKLYSAGCDESTKPMKFETYFVQFTLKKQTPPTQTLLFAPVEVHYDPNGHWLIFESL